MNASSRKGWCPGALRPMAARDGLLVRLRPTGGIMSARVASSIAGLAARHGNGLFDLSARANLQMRGVSQESLPSLLRGLDDLDLLDRDAGAEAVRNVVSSPLAGLRDGLDIRPLVAALEARLVDDVALRALPGKFGFVVDDGGRPSLADVTADVRFDWLPEEQTFSIGLGGTRDGAIRIGACAAAAVPERSATMARGAIGLFARLPDRRRMAGLIKDLGPGDVAAACGGVPGPALAPPGAAGAIVGRQSIDGVEILGLGAPFGRLDAAMLEYAADLAARWGDGEVRLTPWRTVLVPGYRANATGGDAAGRFIADAAHPLLQVVACVGREGCERGGTPTRRDAAILADALGPSDGGVALHVSGCEKGCARPSTTAVTLVGRDGRYDLVRDGRAGDPPSARGLTLAEVRAALGRTASMPPIPVDAR